jgi:hypothetical protein
MQLLALLSTRIIDQPQILSVTISLIQINTSRSAIQCFSDRITQQLNRSQHSRHLGLDFNKLLPQHLILLLQRLHALTVRPLIRIHPVPQLPDTFRLSAPKGTLGEPIAEFPISRR